MKKNLLFFTLLVFTLSFGQTKKRNTKKIVKKEIPIEERINVIKVNEHYDVDLIAEPEPTYRQEQENIDIIYNSVEIEIKPEFIGGNKKLQEYLSQTFEISNEMKENELKGKVYVSFVVERDGSLSNIKILRDIGYETGKEAIRVLKKMPRWKPGEQNGKKVRCSYTIPIIIYATKQ